MRIISRTRLREWSIQYPDAATALARWADVVEEETWRNIQEVRRTFPTADAVVVRSGRVVTVFNIRGNVYRLITAIHYNTELVFLLRFLTHGEYDLGKWKDTL